MATSVAMYVIIAIVGTVFSLQSLYEAFVVVVFLLAEENRRRLQRMTFQVHVWIPEDFRHRCGMECSLLSVDVTGATTLEQVIEECRTRLHTLPPLDLHITEKHDVYHRKFGDATTIGDLRLEEGSVVYLRATLPNGRGVLGAGTGAVRNGGNGRRGPDKQPRKRSCRKKTQPPASKSRNTLQNVASIPTLDLGNHPRPSTGDSPTVPRSSAPPISENFVEQYIHATLKDLKHQLETESGDTYDRLKAGHMWITAPNPVVACRRSSLSPAHFYKPDIFCWLPKLYFPDLHLRCPRCGTTGRHTKNGYASNPEARRVRGLRKVFYVFSSVLKCEHCRQSFYATHPDVISHLPMAFSSEVVVPFVLTESSGLDADVVWLMPSLFNDGVTPEAFHRTIDEAYQERRDLLHATYNALCDYYMPNETAMFGDSWRPQQFDPSVVDVKAPSAVHLASVFRHQTLLQKAYITVDALRRSASSLAYDFSHKVPKMMAKLAGHRIFDSLFQATNEFGEIVMFFFTVGTAFDQVKNGIKQWLHVRDLLGQSKPKVIFTDKCCEDESLVMECFPYLRDTVSAASPLLPHLTLPRKPILISHEGPADAIATTWISKAQESRHPVAAGVDCEWDSAAGQRSKVATLQVAFEGDELVYVFRLSKLGKIPRKLKLLLESPRVFKVGKSIAIDKKRLSEDYDLVVESADGSLQKSWVDLGVMAARLNAAVQGSSLAKLVANVLRRELPKPSHIRRSQWTVDQLSEEQLTYAALDAYAGLLIYLRLAEVPDPSVRLAPEESPRALGGAPTPLTGMAVELIAGHSVAARGKILPLGTMQVWERTKVTRTRVLVQIEEVLANAAASKYPVGSSRSLGSFGECPFTLLVDIASLRPRSMPTHSEHDHNHTAPFVDCPNSPETARHDEPVRCCLQDVFHLMKRIKVKKSHPFYNLYVIALSDAFFVWNQDDLSKVEASLRARGEDPLYWRLHRREYFLRRVRRRIPVPSILRGRVQETCGHFADLRDHCGAPLFDDRAHRDLQNLLEHIDKGCCSDPSGDEYAFYLEVGVDSNGLSLYRCSRGTNCCESNHRVLKKKFGSLNAGIALTEALMLQHVLRTNMRAAENHRPGHYKIGHFKPWLVDFINLFGKRVWGEEPRPECPSSLDWNWDVLTSYAPMFHFGGQTDPSNRGNPHPCLSGDKKHLAGCQGARLPYLPLHTDEEKVLYNKVLPVYVRSNGSGAIDFERLAACWNNAVECVWKEYDDELRAHGRDAPLALDSRLNALSESELDMRLRHPNVFFKFSVHLKRYHDDLSDVVVDRDIRRSTSSYTRSLMRMLWGPGNDTTGTGGASGSGGTADSSREAANDADVLDSQGRPLRIVQSSIDQDEHTAESPVVPHGDVNPVNFVPSNAHTATVSRDDIDDVAVPMNTSSVGASQPQSNTDDDIGNNPPRVNLLPGMGVISTPAVELHAGAPVQSKRPRALVTPAERRCGAVKHRHRSDGQIDDEDLVCGVLGCPGVHRHINCSNNDRGSFMTRREVERLRYKRDAETRRKRRHTNVQQ